MTFLYVPSRVSPIETVSGSTASTGALVEIDGDQVTITLDDASASFDMAEDATTSVYFGGAVTETSVSFAASDASNESLARVDLSTARGWAPEYSQTFLYESESSGEVEFQALIAVGANDTTTLAPLVAEFEIAVYGYYINHFEGTADRFYGVGTYVIDFTTQEAQGIIDDIDFTSVSGDPSAVSETASDGADFGLSFSGKITSDHEFGGLVGGLGQTVLAGEIRGGFFGPQAGKIQEIAGVFHFFGVDVYAYGILAGQFAPFEPGSNRSGGIVTSDGFVGAFRGPSAGVVREGSDYLLVVSEQRAPGDENDIVAELEPTTSPTDEPRLTITIGARQLGFDLDDADVNIIQDGGGTVRDFITEQFVIREVGGETQAASVYTFNLDNDPRAPGQTRTRYSRLLSFGAFDGPDGPLELYLFMPIGADAVSMPANGTARFTSGVLGQFLGVEGSAPFNGRGDVVVDFGSGSVHGMFEDVDFLPSGGVPWGEFGPGGVDFGLQIDAEVVGDDFAGSITATRADMSGNIIGDFYGPTGSAPEEIGAAFSMIGADGAAFGGLQGILDANAGD